MSEVLRTADDRDALLVQVLEDHMAALEAGTAPPRAELLARHPELAEQLNACLASLDFIRRATASSSVHSRPAPEPALIDGTLGDYRIVREIGRGGMGIVYEAQPQSPRAPGQKKDERVALKVLPFAAALDPRQLQRFKNEAQAAALLCHPHIVPVLDVGCDRGVHFYVMQLIDGRNLAAMIRDLRQQAEKSGPAGKEAGPEDRDKRGAGDQDPGTETVTNKEPDTSEVEAVKRPWRHQNGSVSLLSGLPGSLPSSVARLGIQAAEALEQAHQVGIIHRDIKPANLLVDDRGHLWITDFGLARFENEANLTLTGDMLGTLRYMSPEQGLARRGVVDQRSDIYSLGVTLYELLTLQPAVVGHDREELLERIAKEDPIPPRHLNPAIPRDLETIVQKASAKSPADRYLTAAELAGDLRCFLDGKPIQARRPTPMERARTWAHRHQSVVVGGAVVVCVAIIALALSTFFIAQERDQVRRRERQARRAVDEMYTEVAQRWWSQQPFMEQVQREFLLRALQFYEEFAEEKSADPEVRLETARAARRVGDIRHRLGDSARAATAYQQALVRLRQLRQDSPNLPGCRDELAQVHNNRGNLFRDSGQLAEAVQEYRDAQTLFAEPLALPSPPGGEGRVKGDPDSIEGLAGSCNNLGLVLHALGRLSEAEAAYRQALDRFDALTADHPAIARYRHALASSRANLAGLLRDTGRLAEAQAAYEQALADWQKLRAESGDVPVFLNAQAAAYHGRGILLAARGNTAMAERDLRQSLALRERLAMSYPGVPAYRQAAAASQHGLGRLLASVGETTEAVALYDQALARRRQLVADFPTVNNYRQELADTLHGRGSLLASGGKLPQAEKDLEEALTMRQALAAAAGETPEARGDLARSHRALGSLSYRRGSLRAAEQSYRAAIELEEKLVSELSNVPAYRLELAETCNDLGIVLQAGNRLAEAEALHRKALSLRQQLAEQLPRMPYYQREMAAGQGCLADLLQQADRIQEAEQAYGHAITIAEKLTTDFPKQPEYRTLWAEYLGRLGSLRFESARLGEATQAFCQELEQREQLVAEFPGTSAQRDLAWFLATCPDPAFRDIKRAQALARKVVEAAPQDGLSWTTLGVAEYRAGAWEAAGAALQKAVQLGDADHRARVFLAMTHWQQGHPREARDCLAQDPAWQKGHRPGTEELRRFHVEARSLLGQTDE